MARLNGRRRRIAAQRRALTELAKANNPSTQAKSGNVRSSYKPHVADQVIPSVARAYAPNTLISEGRGKLGKVVRGTFVPKKPGQRQRFGKA